MLPSHRRPYRALSHHTSHSNRPEGANKSAGDCGPFVQPKISDPYERLLAVMRACDDRLSGAGADAQAEWDKGESD
jgi:hypothetical protein